MRDSVLVGLRSMMRDLFSAGKDILTDSNSNFKRSQWPNKLHRYENHTYIHTHAQTHQNFANTKDVHQLLAQICTQTYTHMHIQLFLKLCFLLIFFIAENIGRVAIKEPLFEHVLQQTELCPRAIDLLTLVLTQVATRKDEWLRFVFFIIT